MFSQISTLVFWIIFKYSGQRFMFFSPKFDAFFSIFCKLSCRVRHHFQKFNPYFSTYFQFLCPLFFLTIFQAYFFDVLPIFMSIVFIIFQILSHNFPPISKISIHFF